MGIEGSGTKGLTHQRPRPRGIYAPRSASLPGDDSTSNRTGAKPGTGAAAQDFSLAIQTGATTRSPFLLLCSHRWWCAGCGGGEAFDRNFHGCLLNGTILKSGRDENGFPEYYPVRDGGRSACPSRTQHCGNRHGVVVEDELKEMKTMKQFTDEMFIAMIADDFKKWIGVLVREGDVHGVSTVNAAGARTASGYFTDQQKMAEAIASLNWGASVWMTLNPCDPALLAHGNNHLETDAGNPTRDFEIIRRLWFLTDLKPIRRDEFFSSAPEKLAATVRARDVLAYLSERGWPQPIPMDSGEGFQIRYRIDLPNDEESTQLVKRCLHALAARFDGAGVKVDASAFDASRIAMVPDTLATEGDPTRGHDRRITGLMKFNPKDVRVVSKELLQALAAEAPKEEQVVPKGQKLDGFVDGESGQAGAETQKRAICKNSDNDDLLPRRNAKFVLGYVDEVNGIGAEEIQAYVPTRKEIRELVKYWYRQVLDNSWFFFIYGQTGSSEWRLGVFADRRIARADAAIGKKAVDAALKEASEEFRTKVVKDDRLWQIFENRAEVGYPAVWDELHKELFDRDLTQALKRLDELEKEFPTDFIALVLCDDESRAILISPGDSDFKSLLQGSGQFEVLTDRSGLGPLGGDFEVRGFLRAARRNGEWRFDFPDAVAGNWKWDFLEGVAGQMRKLLDAGTGK